jgi:misacylated tRNA(Ala) deacylase
VSLIQDETNALVFEGRRVHIEVEELHIDNVPGVFKLENGRSAGKALPSDYTGGVKRTVVIDGVDRNPWVVLGIKILCYSGGLLYRCCGTHMPSLHNLQLFLLPHTEALCRSSATSARLYFLAGPRLITYLTSTHDQITQASSILSCGAPRVPDRVSQVVEERRAAEKRVADLESQLVSIVAKELLHSLHSATKALTKRGYQRASTVTTTPIQDREPRMLHFLWQRAICMSLHASLAWS